MTKRCYCLGLGITNYYHMNIIVEKATCDFGQNCGWRRETGLNPPVKYFTDRSKAVRFLWIFHVVFFLSCFCYAFVRVCLYVPCGHLLGKGWPLGSRLWCLTLSLLLSHWYPGSGVVLNCIDS